MAASSKSSGVSLGIVTAVWALAVLAAAILGTRVGLGGHRFFIALAIIAALFAFELFLAVPRIQQNLLRTFGNSGGMLAPLVPLFCVLLYCSTVTRNWPALLAGAAYVVLPMLLLASSRGKSPGTWEDFAAIVLLWAPIGLPQPYRLLYRIFPYPSTLTHTYAILLALGTGVAAFVLFRRLPDVGYSLDWKSGFGWNFAFHFLVFAAISIPLGIEIGFLTWHPALRPIPAAAVSGIGSFILSGAGILLFTAIPEEFLFRGLLQNSLAKTFQSDRGGLIVAAIIFGFSHIFHAPVPNWRYVLLATIAGIFYGSAWMKTRSLVPGVLIHALVDTLWHVLFR